MSREALFKTTKVILGIDKDVDLAKELGIGRSFLCLVKNGTKNMPDGMKDKITALTRLTRDEIETIIAKEDSNDAANTNTQSLPPLSLVQSKVRHESGVLQGEVRGRSTETPARDEVRPSEEGGGQGVSEQAHHDGESGAGEEAPVAGSERAEVPKRRATVAKKGTRAAVVLKEGAIYYPADENSEHSHRRLIGIVRQKDKPTMCVYSIGSDHNHVCQRNTFLRWLDPKRAA